MYNWVYGFTNYAGQLEICLFKSNETSKSQTSKFKSIKHKSNLDKFKSNSKSTKFKQSINRIKDEFNESSKNRSIKSIKSTRSTRSNSQRSNSYRSNSINQIMKPIKLNKFKMLILCLIYSLLCTGSLVNGQFFRPPLPNNNNLASNSFDSPNEIGSIELFVHENARNHHTSDYEIVDGINPPLVIRRSDVFIIGIKFRRPYDPRRDKVRLEFMFGKFKFGSFVLSYFIKMILFLKIYKFRTYLNLKSFR